MDLNKIIQHENEHWSKIFNEELKKDFKDFSSYWWKDYYKNIIEYFDNYISKNNYKNLLEAGSGSGKASILLNKNLQKNLLDISDVALTYSKYLSKKFNENNISYTQGDIFSMPFKSKTFNFVWNIGVLEHYNKLEVRNIMSEMIRVTSENGTVVIAVPNLYSGPIIKAKILSHALLKFIPGYRLDTELFYKEKDIRFLFLKAANENKRVVEKFTLEYFGNPLPMETPRVILKTVGKLIYYIFLKNRFIKFFIFKLK